MSATKTQCQQEFLLGPDKARTSMRPLLHSPARDPKAQKEKMSMFKRHLASSRLRSDEAIRRKVEMLKEQRSLSNLSKSGIQKEMEAASKARMEEELGRPVSSKEWPFVYFVVTLDQFPQNSEEMNAEHSTRTAQTARERQRFLTARRRKIQETREENERIREAGIDMGLRLEPIKPVAPPPDQSAMSKIRNRPSLTKHPPTPVSSIGSRPEFSFLNSQDDLADCEQTRKNIGYLISDTLSQAGMTPKNGRHCPISSLELPEISSSAKRRALGVSTRSKTVGLGERKVTFAEGLPVIKGNGIPVSNGVSSSLPAPASDYVNSPLTPSSENRERSFVRDKKSGEDPLRTPWSMPLTTRSLNSLGPKSRLFAPMALPKVDIVSEIYDELIVKTIQNYLLAEGYSNDKLQQLRQTVLARLSATYPHLVKHKAWRLTHSPCDKLYTADEESEEVVMADPEKLQPRTRMHGRFNKVVIDRGLTYDHVRPFTSPNSLLLDSEPLAPNFMAIDGRTMTFSSRDELQFRHSSISNSNIGASSTYSKLPATAEEREREIEEVEGVNQAYMKDGKESKDTPDGNGDFVEAGRNLEPNNRNNQEESKSDDKSNDEEEDKVEDKKGTVLDNDVDKDNNEQE